MTNKTFIPAFKAHMGDWDYYICIMQYGEVARQVSFGHELGGKADLNSIIQRGLTARSEAIRKYLKLANHHFLGSLIVAVWGGDPQYTHLGMDDPDALLSGIDRGFGVLTFDGTQQYFALDGQHRLRAIKDAILEKPELGRDDICVIIVSHMDTPQGRIRTRRLFTNINRNAKKTTQAEDIVLDEDDGAAILTRRLVLDHPWFKQEGLVRVITRQGKGGELSLAGRSISQTDPHAVTTITTLYDIVAGLTFGLDPTMRTPEARPSDDVLDNSYDIILKRIDDLFEKCGNIPKMLRAGITARDLRVPTNADPIVGRGHSFMRPIVQVGVVRVLAAAIEQGRITWDSALERLAMLAWKLEGPPWSAVFNPANGRMITAKENKGLLVQLLHAHIAPETILVIQEARQEFLNVKGQQYPVSEDELSKGIV